MTLKTAFKFISLPILVLAGLAIARVSPASRTQEAPAAEPIAMDLQATGLRVELGREEGREQWSGEVSISAGTVSKLELWEQSVRSKVDGLTFDTGTLPRRAQGGGGQRSGKPQLFLTLAAPPSAQLTLSTNRGVADFLLSEAAADRPLQLLEDRVQVWRSPPVFRLERPGVDDDFPAAAADREGKVWVVYSSYQRGQPADREQIRNQQFDSLVPENNGDRIYLTSFDGQSWSPPLAVTEALSDVWRPAAAAAGDGTIWITWSEQKENNWDLYQRRWDPAREQFSEIQRLTTDPGADVNVVSTADSAGQVWWAWQAWRGDNFRILLASSRHSSQPLEVADTPANEWNPAIAADSAGNVYVAWDSYASGNYDVLVRRFGPALAEAAAGEQPVRRSLGGGGSQPGPALAVADTPYFEARASLACDSSNRLWIAYEEDDPNWGKDYATEDENRPVENLGTPLYLNRRIRVKCLQDGRLKLPAGELSAAFTDQLARPKSFPQVAVDRGDNVQLFFRHHARPDGRGTLWAGYLTRYDGSTWSPAQLLSSSDYLMDNRAALVPWKESALLAIYSSDDRLRGGRPETDNDLFVAVIARPGMVNKVNLLPNPAETVPGPVPAIHPDESEAVRRLREYRLGSAGKSYRILRGEFHRHTEYTSHRDQDGSLEDMWRYGLDAAAMDWIGNGDHNNGQHREYAWWIIQKISDIFDHSPHFVPPFTYERSLRYPNGHRNVMFARRGIRPLPQGELPGTPEEGTPDTKLLYAYLRHFGGICASHTSGTNMGTDWRDNDPEVEPVVEIYQGHRHNYEAFGAPRSPTSETQIGGYQPAGFVWNALARGYRLGIESSSDHVSTHMSYTMVLVEEATREGLVEALRKRHCYAATDNILLEVRSGNHIMGDEFTSEQPAQLEVKAVGTKPIREIVIVKDNGYVYRLSPNSTQVDFTWQDLNQPAGALSYYYVRLEQEDGQLAWSSPVWVRYQ